jgi:O-antigen/teichoic acid export membrane protein
MASPQDSSYKQIAKATSIFGGVQAYNIVLSIARTKLLAVLLGPAGMGLNGLLTGTTAMVASLTDLGLGFAAVKDIAAAHASGDARQMARTAKVFQRLVWLSGLLGTVVILGAAPWLSEFTFHHRGYTQAFMVLSVTLLLGQLAASRNVLLQGTRRLSDLAAATVASATAGLAVSLPFYLLYGEQGIVSAIVASAIASLAVAYFFGRRVAVEDAEVTLAETLHLGRSMVATGIVVSLNGLALAGSAYLLRVFISSHGSVADVGLYSAGFGVLNTYVGMVFNAMLSDYYPRLTAAMGEDSKWRQIVNDQANFALLVLAPILIGFIVFINLVVIILYSERFLAIDGMMRWAALGVLLKAASWPMGFLFVSKGHSKRFLYSEVAANAYMLGFNIAGYQALGLAGLGIAFFLGYAIYFLQVAVLTNRFYGFRFNAGYFRLLGLQGALALATFAGVAWLPPWPGYALGTAVFGLSAWVSLTELNRHLDLRGLLGKVKARLGR